ncbi:hypothetical protein NDU88_005436 [Pleurodeles waltl]|uniref:Uncharacterized protein n=1 Tax=Pleurodeles waltl TaxID=8319 RepID=A0AAV7PIV0_PLEWA|nr:hypothetical protein NDU88_005436 [Pleurodeles waltl]
MLGSRRTTRRNSRSPPRRSRFEGKQTMKTRNQKRGVNRRSIFPRAFTKRITLPVNQILKTPVKKARVTNFLNLIFRDIIHQHRRRTRELTRERIRDIRFELGYMKDRMNFPSMRQAKTNSDRIEQLKNTKRPIIARRELIQRKTRGQEFGRKPDFILRVIIRSGSTFLISDLLHISLSVQ